LGVLTYFFLCGRFPFEAETREDLEAKILKGEYDFKGIEWSLISNEAKDFISKCLIINP
jgi:serine/threonine protein kinase